MSDRTVLMVSYRFPPCQAFPTAAERVRGLARWLPRFGWHPVVLAPLLPGPICGSAACGHPRADMEHDAQSEIDVVRVPVEATLPVRAIMRSERERHRPGRSATGVRLIASLMRVLQGRATDWHEAALQRGREVARERGASVLWITAGPYRNVPLGHALAQTTGLPWALDLRDPISRVLSSHPVVGWAERARRRSYRPHVRAADRVIEATRGFAETDRRWLERDYVVIRSGFDPEIWDTPSPTADADGEFEVVYLGALYPGRREPDLYLAGLSHLRDATGWAPKLVYYGRNGDLLLRTAARFGVEDVVDIRGTLPPAEARRRMRSATVLLLLTNTGSYEDWPGGKFYEYLGARRPILAVPDEDRFVRATLARTGAGVCTSTPSGVADAVSEWKREHRTTSAVRYRGDLEEIEEYSIVRSAELLAQLFDATGPDSVTPRQPWGIAD